MLHEVLKELSSKCTAFTV